MAPELAYALAPLRAVGSGSRRLLGCDLPKVGKVRPSNPGGAMLSGLLQPDFPDLPFIPSKSALHLLKLSSRNVRKRGLQFQTKR